MFLFFSDADAKLTPVSPNSGSLFCVLPGYHVHAVPDKRMKKQTGDMSSFKSFQISLIFFKRPVYFYQYPVVSVDKPEYTKCKEHVFDSC